jgi:hypothetical protein
MVAYSLAGGERKMKESSFSKKVLTLAERSYVWL